MFYANTMIKDFKLNGKK